MSQAEAQVAALLVGGKKVRTVRGTVTAVIDGSHASVWLPAERRTATCYLPAGMMVAVDYEVLVSIDANTHTLVRILAAPWSTAGFSAASGWSITAAAWRIVGGMASVAIEVVRTGSSVTVSSAGNFSNINIITVPAAVLPTAWPIAEIPCLWRGTYGAGGGHMVPGTGVVSVDDWHSSGVLDNGDTLSALLVYPL